MLCFFQVVTPITELVQRPLLRNFSQKKWYNKETCVIIFGALLVTSFFAFDRWWWNNTLEEMHPEQSQKTPRLRFAKPHVDS